MIVPRTDELQHADRQMSNSCAICNGMTWQPVLVIKKNFVSSAFISSSFLDFQNSKQLLVVKVEKTRSEQRRETFD